jgi:parvulin-like peptidyl-prolyl isomerase
MPTVNLERSFQNTSLSSMSFSIAQIYFNPKKGSGSEALTRAEETLSKLSGGESFESLANKYNEDPRANKDGYLGEL